MKLSLHKVISLSVLLLIQMQIATAQVTASLNSQIGPVESQQSLKEFLTSLERTFKVYFTFESSLVRDKKINNDVLVSKNLEETLQRALEPLNLRYEKISEKYYTIYRESEGKTDNGAVNIIMPEFDETVDNLEVSTNTIPQILRVRGTITDETGLTMPGVNVLEKGSTNGVVTDSDGKFAIDVEGEQSVLVISFVGYETIEEVVGARTDISIQLLPDIKTLSEIVVVGYSTQERKNLTAAVSTINMKELENRPVTNMFQALQGVAPNLTIQQNNAEPGSVQTLNIRGVGSFTDNSPLIIVDGIAVGPLGLNYLNPNDVESISVLKDAASSAIYGSQAANGVIYVTTKRGSKDEKISVHYSGLFGLQSPTASPKAVEGWEFMTLKNEALANSGLPPQFTPQQIRERREQGSEPWVYDEAVNNTVPQINQNISVSGGSKNTSYLLSVGYMNQQSMLNGAYVPDEQKFFYKRYNFRSNISTQINKYIKADVNLSFANGTTRSHAFSTGFMMRDAMRTPRIYPIKDDEGNFVVPPLTSNSVFAQLSQGGYKLLKSNNLLGGLVFTVTPIDHLKVIVNTSANYSFYNEGVQVKKFTYAPQYTTAAPPLFNEQRKSSWEDFSKTFFATAEYERTFGLHSAKVLVGYRSDYEREYSFLSARRVGGTILDNEYMISGDFNRNGDGDIIGKIDDYNGMLNPELVTINSVFGRFNYAYDDRYLAEFTWRYDGSTVLAPQNRWFFFPAFSLGWRLTNENFMASVKDVAEVKLRYSWGQVGNSSIGGFNYLKRVNLIQGMYSFNNASTQGATFTPVNPELDWERSSMANYGADVELLDGRLMVSFDYFDKTTNGIYWRQAVPGTLGQEPSLDNFAKVRNVGWELAVNYRLTTGQVNHTIGANIADNQNRVERIGQEIIEGVDFNFITREGFPMSSYYLYKSDGFYQNLDDIENAPEVPFAQNQKVNPGDIRYVDRNGDNVIDGKDRYIMETPFPRFTFGVTYAATWKNFDFMMFWQGVGKRVQYLRGDIVEAFHNNEEHLFVQHKDRWTPTNPDASYPRLTASTAVNANNVAFSDFWLFDTKYLRLKNLQVGYTLPTKIVSKVGLNNVRVFFSGQNLLTFAPKRFKRLGMDPEFTQFDNKLDFANYDPIAGRNYPNARVVSIGLDVKF